MKDHYLKSTIKMSVGFVVALGLSYLAYFAATQGWWGKYLALGLMILAATQFVWQLVVFLHVGREAKPRFTLWSLICGIFMMLVVVVGSLWVMANLNYNMHIKPADASQYMLEQNKKGF